MIKQSFKHNIWFNILIHVTEHICGVTEPNARFPLFLAATNCLDFLLLFVRLEVEPHRAESHLLTL